MGFVNGFFVVRWGIYKKVYFFVILLEGDGESMVFFRSRPLLLNSALSATILTLRKAFAPKSC